MSFVESFVQSFEADPKAQSLFALKKSQLTDLCTHYRVELQPGALKRDVLRALVRYCVEEDVLPVESLDAPQLKAAESSRLEKEREYALKMKELEMREKELLLKVRECELETERVKHQKPRAENERAFDVGKNLSLVPKFNEQDVEKFFAHFEKIAQSCKWPENAWSVMVQSVLTGKAQEVYAALCVQDSFDYQVVKTSILKSYELVPEAYRQRFRSLQKTEKQTYVEFAREKETLFDRWISSRDARNFEGLRQMMLLEEFKRCIPKEMKVHLDRSLSISREVEQVFLLCSRTFGLFTPFSD